ncbi:unnamed protein product [Amoebophrya sp. A120]|nr:unnamed protein product [Amoebophrya sp. A120]|eukprot:GSA120T00011177001.1
MAAASSSSSEPTSSNGAAAMDAIANGTSRDSARREPTVPDLLVSYKGKYQDWIEQVKEISYKNMERACETRVLDAQINLWQFFATRQVARTQKKSLPADVRRVIRGFLGQPGASESAGARGAEIATETARATDRLRAIQYYEGLIMDAAKTGAEEFEITRAVWEAAPVSRGGTPVDPLLVGCYLADQLGYRVTLGRRYGERVSCKLVENLEFDDEDGPRLGEALPLFVVWPAGHEVGLDACTPSDIRNIERIKQGKTLVATGGEMLSATLPENPAASQRKDTLSELEKCFVAAVDTACSSARTAVYELARQAFSQGLSEFVVDEQVWADVAAKSQLAGEKSPPLFRQDVEALVAGDTEKKCAVADLLPSVARRLAFQTDGLCVTPTLPADFNPDDDIDQFLKFSGKLNPRLPLRLRPKFGQDATDELSATRENV